jgi:serine/threonine protein kinase
VTLFGWYSDDNNIYLAMEYFSAGDLSRWKNEITREADIQNISRQIALGLQVMHEMNIIHRDMKPEVSLLFPRTPGPLDMITYDGNRTSS